MVRSVVSLGLASLLVMGAGTGLAPRAAGQSVLKRLEQEIRQRVAEDRAAAAEPAGETQPPRNSGYLGAVVDDRQDRGRGVRVLDVRPEGPADVAGLREGDLITGAAGVRVRQTDDLADVMAVFPPESRVTFDVLRRGQTAKIDVVLGHRDSPFDTLLVQPEAIPMPLPEPRADPVEPPVKPRVATKPPPASPPPDFMPEVPPPPPPADPDEVAQLRARVAELERRVEQLEQAIADALTKNATGPAPER